VDRYASAVEKATGQPATVQNLSQHNSLTLPGLLAELDSFRPQLSAADVIVIGIAHNSNELSADAPCGAPVTTDQLPDWPTMTRACAKASAAKYRPQYDQLFSTVAAWRSGAPTILRTINRYDDYRGAPTITLTAAQQATVTTFIKTWDDMLCASATQANFACADIYRAFNGPAGDKPSGDLLSNDYTHPSDKGNELIAKTLTDEGFAPLA
jgi:lysophospholipase L1-like esterase